MIRRRRLKGKKLLVAGMSISASSLLGSCSESVANLVAPPEDSGMDASRSLDASTPRDATPFFDAPVANLIPPPEDAGDEDAGDLDAGYDAGNLRDARIIFPLDAPIANLVPPPPDESTPDESE